MCACARCVHVCEAGALTWGRGKARATTGCRPNGSEARSSPRWARPSDKNFVAGAAVTGRGRKGVSCAGDERVLLGAAANVPNRKSRGQLTCR